MDTVTFHESEDRLELYALGRLPDSENERIENHLIVCDTCRERLEEVSAFAFSMREVLKDKLVTEADARWFGWLQPRLAVGGALATLLMAAGVYEISADRHVLPVASLQLTSLRGSEVQTVAPARELDLTFTDAPTPARLDIVDAAGATVWTGTLQQQSEGKAEVRISQSLSTGDYFARIFTGTGRLLHEYQFKVAK